VATPRGRQAARKPKKRAPRKTARKARATARKRTALDLRIEGKTFEVIAKTLGISRQGAWDLVDRELKRLAEDTKDQAEELRALDLERVDFALRGLVGKVRRGVPPAAQAYLKALERRAHLLGLDAPSRHEHSGPDGAPIPLSDARTALAAALASAGADTAPEAAGDPTGKPP